MTTWQDVWSWLPNIDEARQQTLLRDAAIHIISLSAEDQIKALRGAPEKFVENIRPYLKAEARLKPYEALLPIRAEDWAEAQKRWKELKEKK